MTRINAGIPVESLTDQHLVAEYREILRIGTLFKKRIDSNKSFNDIPEQFTLGRGHVKFFYNKGLYINRRWHQLYNELLIRNFKPTLQFYDHWENQFEYKLDYEPTSKAISEVKYRIRTNLRSQKDPIRYKGQIITIDHYIHEILKPSN